MSTHNYEFTAVLSRVLEALGFYIESTEDEVSAVGPGRCDVIYMDAGGIKYAVSVHAGVIQAANLDNGRSEAASYSEDDHIESARNVLTAIRVLDI